MDIIRLETDKQSSYHLNLAQQIKNDLEAQATTFCAKQNHHKKVYQSAIEKEFKAKQNQESYVKKAREKYEQDCMRINSYTAQSTLVQGRDLEKIQLKLDRAQTTVQTNERDFANFARAFQDTAAKWEQDWKTFCDTCQDLEEDRLEFMKDNMWAYANAVSTVCVSDDEVRLVVFLSYLSAQLFPGMRKNTCWSRRHGFRKGHGELCEGLCHRITNPCSSCILHLQLARGRKCLCSSLETSQLCAFFSANESVTYAPVDTSRRRG